MTTPKKRGPAKGQGGRPKGTGSGVEKVKLTVRILPETLAAIRAKGAPGAVIDAAFRVGGSGL